MLYFLAATVLSYFLSRISQNALSGIVLVSAAVVLFLKDRKETGKRFPLAGLFSLSFVGGEGIACFKLSSLETAWEPETWLCFFAAVFFFRLFYRLTFSRNGVSLREPQKNGFCLSGEKQIREDRLFISVIGITVLSAVSFCIEAAILGYVPLLIRGVPHAYSAFHVHGLHYFTVSCVLVPALAVIWNETSGRRDGIRKKAVHFSAAVSLLIPILCVSRFQLIFTVAVAGFTFLTVKKDGAPKHLGIIAVCCIIPLYVLLTVARSHSVSYLNGIFEMKADLPIFISQPYIYIANNYDNFNCLVRDLTSHTFGLRMLYPLWAFTGMKFLHPSLVNFPLYVTKKELTTVTLFYDAWYDFGMAGVILFSALLGFVSRKLEEKTGGPHDPIMNVMYAQMAVYSALAFFTTWFSNPATWFYFAETLAVYLFCRSRGKKPEKRGKKQ